MSTPADGASLKKPRKTLLLTLSTSWVMARSRGKSGTTGRLSATSRPLRP